MKEGLSPGRASAAVFVGCFVGVVPIYGFQSVTAVALAAILSLNKPLTFAATFVNNPILQPVLIFSSVELGHLALRGRFLPLALSDLKAVELKQQLAAWLVGSVILGLLLGAGAAFATFAFLSSRQRDKRDRRDLQRECSRFVNSLFVECARYDRGFVKWKMRLDKLFRILLTEDLGNGPVVDLGCGYGLALALAGFRDPGRRLIGCDLDAHRIETARRALQPLKAELSLADVRNFEFRDAGLIVIIDVLQYLRPEEQLTLLRRCCSLLAPGGRLICRIHDKNRGIASMLSLGLDRLLFLLRPRDQYTTVLSSAEYHVALKNAGMVLWERPFINWLPLAHILLTAEKPRVEQG